MSAPAHYGSAASRWAGVGPYYAMFPSSFADRVVKAYTNAGDVVLDPFAGRGTSIFSAATQGRTGVGIDIHPVGFVYAKTKLAPADKEAVRDRLRAIGSNASSKRVARQARELPPFFQKCFADDVRRFLVAARERLNWRRSSLDRTVMALTLVYLHGKEGAALSNQMRQTKAVAPAYAMRWWRDHETAPPELDPVEFLEARLNWRYAKGVPQFNTSLMYLGNSEDVLSRVAQEVRNGALARARLLFTSPPYFGVTNYHYDQWLRLWLLGGPPNAGRTGNGRGGKFEHRDKYETLLANVFRRAKDSLRRDATIYVRTDARAFTRNTTINVLRTVFPAKTLSVRRRPLKRATQTQLFGPSGRTAGEVDVILESS